jgi:hypothetical protein
MLAADHSHISRPHPGWTLALTSVAFFMVTLDSLVVITALPAMHQSSRRDCRHWNGR